MLIQSRTLDDKKLRYVHGHLQGGAAFCLLTPIYLDAIERYTGKTTHQLHTGGLSCASGGVFAAAAASFSDPQDASRPLFLMKEFKQVFKELLPVCLEVPSGFVRNQIRATLVNKIFHHHSKKPIHLQTAKLEKHVKDIFGNVTLQQATGTLFINTQKIHPPPIEPFDFYHFAPGLLHEESLQPLNNPAADIPITKCILATAALPGAFSAIPIEIGGQVCQLVDSGECDRGMDNLLLIRRNLPDHSDVGFILYGNVGHDMDLPPHEYNTMGFLDLSLKQITRKFSAQQLNARTLSTLRAELGAHNVFDIEFPTVNSPLSPKFKIDKLDVSPAQLEALWECGHRYVEDHRNEWIRQVGDWMGNHHERIQQARRADIPAVVTQQAYDNNLILSKHTASAMRTIFRLGRLRFGVTVDPQPHASNGSRIKQSDAGLTPADPTPI